MSTATALLEAFAAPGALERIVTVPFGTVPGSVALHLRLTEVLVHGWDLAKATGQSVEFPADLAEQELVFSQSALEQLPPDRRPFAPSQPVGQDAPGDRAAGRLPRPERSRARLVTAPAGGRYDRRGVNAMPRAIGKQRRKSCDTGHSATLVCSSR